MAEDKITGFLMPSFVTFIFFMISGVITADDPWGIIAALGMTMVFWPVISLIFMLYYNSKGNESRMKGATISFIASLATILLIFVFGGILES
tara:strand:+ start:6209 stop:6484 length:276 start_codon:yes stop_codon:yes gene_type:complete